VRYNNALASDCEARENSMYASRECEQSEGLLTMLRTYIVMVERLDL
jgi:hypothetical protein